MSIRDLTHSRGIDHAFVHCARRRWPPVALALIALAPTTVLAACADEPTSTSRIAAPAPNANTLADPFTVVNLNDHGIGSLRWVLSYADSCQTIRFDPVLGGQTIVLDSVIKMYLKDITIEGPRDRGITISGGGKSRVFETWTPDRTFCAISQSLGARRGQRSSAATRSYLKTAPCTATR